jgi:Putative polyhydroxyalkanoic acid system protein (PHA_gran_rgn)
MHITIAHKKTVAQAMQVADRSIDHVFKGLPHTPIQIVEQRKKWAGQVMEFGLTAKLGFLKYPIHGKVEVTDSRFAIDVELGLLGKCLPEGQARQSIETRFRGLLS